MPIRYRIITDKKVAYIKASGKITVDEIMVKGARMFAEKKWENGFNVLCDYRETTEFELSNEDLKMIAGQDEVHEPLFNKSKCAVVTTNDLNYGLSRMWEVFSQDSNLTANVFRDIRDAIDWLEMDMDFLAMIEKLP